MSKHWSELIEKNFVYWDEFNEVLFLESWAYKCDFFQYYIGEL